MFKCFRKVFFDLIVEKQVFFFGMSTIEDAVSSLLHVCFTCNIELLIGGGLLAIFSLDMWPSLMSLRQLVER